LFGGGTTGLFVYSRNSLMAMPAGVLLENLNTFVPFKRLTAIGCVWFQNPTVKYTGTFTGPLSPVVLVSRSRSVFMCHVETFTVRYMVVASSASIEYPKDEVSGCA